MGNLEVTSFGGIYRNRNVLLTGHTGFKGSWLALWLQTLGAKVTGLALAPGTNPSHWDMLGLKIDDKRVDIRDCEEVANAVQCSSPEIVFHMAAQSLVRCSYANPLETWSTNVIGTANVLEACRKNNNVRAIVVITTDKCYENQEKEEAYCEEDPLGGCDPYSASKASAELVVSSYRDAFFDKQDAPLLASARAGNVIGGGDWSDDRLIPDIVKAVTKGEVLEIRFPSATRPWQHVLEPLSGYLCLGQKLLENKKEFAEAWNFGPDTKSNCTVKDILFNLKKEWPSMKWRIADGQQPHEASLLHIDSTKALNRLAWKPVWTFDRGLDATVEWYKLNLEKKTVVSSIQLADYTDTARHVGLEWSFK